jgi:membrane-bound lytic murein transglycosylase F
MTEMNVRKTVSVILIVIASFSCHKIADPVHVKDNSSKLEEVMARGVLRVVTDFSSTSYFIYRGQPMGFQYEMLQELANHLGVKLQVTVNNDLEQKFEMLEKDQVDLIAVNLTVTKERKERMDFTFPYIQTRQVLVQRKPESWKKMSQTALDEKLIRNQLDLAKKRICVARNSSYAKRLHNLSEEIGDSIDVEEMDEDDETLIEMVSQGKIDYTVCDEQIAQVNDTYYDNLDIVTPVSFTQNLAWAVAKGATNLKETIDSWLVDFTASKKYALIYRKYYRNKRSAEMIDSDYYTSISGKLSPYDAIIKEYSEEIGWDWRLLASLIYQESRFNPQARSWAGAFGLMQLMPTTGQRFGVGPSSPPRMQIRAGIMYIQWLDERLIDIKDPHERQKFILAAYNIGLGHILDARALAAKNKKNPDVWDNNVADFLLSKSDPKYYTDPVVKYGYCRGTETYQYVADVMERYGHYKNLIFE